MIRVFISKGILFLKTSDMSSNSFEKKKGHLQSSVQLELQRSLYSLRKKGEVRSPSPSTQFPSFLLSLLPSFPLSFFPSFPLSFFPSFLLSLFPSFPLSFYPFPSFPLSLFPSNSKGQERLRSPFRRFRIPFRGLLQTPRKSE